MMLPVLTESIDVTKQSRRLAIAALRYDQHHPRLASNMHSSPIFRILVFDADRGHETMSGNGVTKSNLLRMAWPALHAY